MDGEICECYGKAAGDPPGFRDRGTVLIPSERVWPVLSFAVRRANPMDKVDVSVVQDLPPDWRAPFRPLDSSPGLKCETPSGGSAAR